jgi:hypothetical protein
MNDYEPLDITQWANIGPELFARGEKFVDESWHPPARGYPLGKQIFRGLPFSIGKEGYQNCLVYFGPQGYRQSVEININRSPKWLIFAHRLLETRLYTGEAIGKLIAKYRFRFSDEREVEYPIRERLEISVAPPRWGQLPLLADADQKESFADREGGQWNFLGWRLTEIGLSWPRWFVLWSWKNPYPDAVLNSVRVEPIDRSFFIAAITASNLDEDPIGRFPKKTITIQLKEHMGNFSLSVDRGQVGYIYPLPPKNPDEYLQDSMAGYGQSNDLSNAGVYTQVVSQPSATLELKRADEIIDRINLRELLHQGVAETEKSRVEIVDQELNWVHVRVIDEFTGKPVPCRVHFRSSKGIPYAPHGHHDHLLSDQGTVNIDVGSDVRLGNSTYAYIDGTCQGWLPVGHIFVDIAHGFEYEPYRKMLTLQRGQRELVIPIKRITDMPSQGWYCGDTHVHFLSTFGALLEGQGEDLRIVNLLQTQWGHHFSNIEEFVGHPVASSDGKTIVYTSQENRQHILGHLSLLGLKSPVMPMCSDGPSEAEFGGSLETTLSHWADECHAQGGTVIIPHFPDPNLEAPALIATGRADAVEMIFQEQYGHLEYYRYLNGGYRLPLVGGTDKMSGEVPVGLYRTYVYIPPDQPFDYDSWTHGLLQGRTFLTSGPLLNFQVEGVQIGDTLHLRGNGGAVEVMAEARSIFPIHTLQIVQEGRVVASVDDDEGKKVLSLHAKVTIDHDTWLAARAGGKSYYGSARHFDELRRGVMAHTSPVYVTVGEQWKMNNSETMQYMLTLLHGGVRYIRERSRQYLPGELTHHHHEADHLAYLERPFKDAIEAVKARISANNPSMNQRDL